MIRVITYGTFDMLHMGHVNLLKRASELGDQLYVGVSTDEFNTLKHKKSYFSYEDRAGIVKAIKYVHKVLPETNWEQKIEDIKKYDIDIFVIGDDWKGQFDYLSEFCKVVYLSRTEGISTTKIKTDLKISKR